MGFFCRENKISTKEKPDGCLLLKDMYSYHYHHKKISDIFLYYHVIWMQSKEQSWVFILCKKNVLWNKPCIIWQTLNSQDSEKEKWLIFFQRQNPLIIFNWNEVNCLVWGFFFVKKTGIQRSETNAQLCQFTRMNDFERRMIKMIKWLSKKKAGGMV